MQDLELKTKFREREIVKALEILDIRDINDNQNITIVNSFLERISTIVGKDENIRYEALNFIKQGGRKDIAEIYQLLNMFAVQELLRISMMQTTLSINEESIREFAKITVKAANEYSKGMIALKTYRNGVNIIKNQNNTLNQVNIYK